MDNAEITLKIAEEELKVKWPTRKTDKNDYDEHRTGLITRLLAWLQLRIPEQIVSTWRGDE